MGLDDANPALEDRQPLVAAPRKHGAAVCQRCRARRLNEQTL
jgi:hypothetical protein